MSTENIPAHRIVTCDACKVVTHQGLGKGQRRMKAVLSVTADALDMYGSPACDASFSRDLCDECYCAVAKAVNDAIRALSGRQAPS